MRLFPMVDGRPTPRPSCVSIPTTALAIEPSVTICTVMTGNTEYLSCAQSGIRFLIDWNLDKGWGIPGRKLTLSVELRRSKSTRLSSSLSHSVIKDRIEGSIISFWFVSQNALIQGIAFELISTEPRWQSPDRSWTNNQDGKERYEYVLDVIGPRLRSQQTGLYNHGAMIPSVRLSSRATDTG